MKTPMPDIVGNQGLRRRLCDDVLNNSLPHAYIIAGPKGSGKHSIATQFAAAVACESKHDPNAPIPCSRCLSCRKILDGKSPDLITVKKDGLSVKISQIRELQTDVRIVPNDLDDKFYIIEDAQTMTPEAQNAFLLTLEEPPSFVHFFLLCESSEPLLETVRSRAPVLRTEPVSRDDIREHLIKIDADAANLAHRSPEAFSDLLSIADGSIGRALELVNDKERKPLVARRKMAEELVDFARFKKMTELIRLINEMPQKPDELAPVLTTACVVLRDLIALKQSESAPLCFYTDREAATEKAYGSSISTLLALYDAITEATDDLSKNVNVKLTLTAMIAKI